jgi:uncharacterized membrane protein YtjA (UPF0391 family)
MLKRARTWLVIALVAAIFGFTGLLQNTAMIAQSLFYLCSAFSIISVLFSLFEEEPESAITAKEVQVTSSVVIPAVVANVQSTAEQSLAA